MQSTLKILQFLIDFWKELIVCFFALNINLFPKALQSITMGLIIHSSSFIHGFIDLSPLSGELLIESRNQNLLKMLAHPTRQFF